MGSTVDGLGPLGGGSVVFVAVHPATLQLSTKPACSNIATILVKMDKKKRKKKKKEKKKKKKEEEEEEEDENKNK